MTRGQRWAASGRLPTPDSRLPGESHADDRWETLADGSADADRRLDRDLPAAEHPAGGPARRVAGAGFDAGRSRRTGRAARAERPVGGALRELGRGPGAGRPRLLLLPPSRRLRAD